MFSLCFDIKNPFFSNKSDEVKKDFVVFTKPLTKNKTFELQISKFQPRELVSFNFSGEFTEVDHAGVRLWMSVYGYHFMVNIIDNRHWDHENKRWISEEEVSRNEYDEKFLDEELETDTHDEAENSGPNVVKTPLWTKIKDFFKSSPNTFYDELMEEFNEYDHELAESQRRFMSAYAKRAKRAKNRGKQILFPFFFN